MHALDRRRFLAMAGAVPVVLSPFGGVAWAQVQPAPRAQPTSPVTARSLGAGPDWNRTLVLVELHGGNDGLNTVVPYGFDEYYRARPTLAVGRDKVLKIEPRLGLHPSLAPLTHLWEERHLGIALGVGYPRPNLSHFRSIEIWDTGSDSTAYLDEGWVARLMAEARPPVTFAADGIVLGRDAPGPLFGGGLRTVNLKNPEAVGNEVKRAQMKMSVVKNPSLAHILKVKMEMRHAAESIAQSNYAAADPGVAFPPEPLGRQMEAAAKLLVAGVKTPVIKVALGGFDTHSNQAGPHGQLLSQLARSLDAFAQAMKKKRLWDNVLVMTYSEFGRRVTENSSRGTDHGTAAAHFLMGGKVKGGFYGSQPSLANLDRGNLVHALHYRSLLATVGREWWGLEAPSIKEKSLGAIA